MSILALLGVLSVAWTAYEVGRMSRGGMPRARAWDTATGRPLRCEIVD